MKWSDKNQKKFLWSWWSTKHCPTYYTWVKLNVNHNSTKKKCHMSSCNRLYLLNDNVEMWHGQKWNVWYRVGINTQHYLLYMKCIFYDKTSIKHGPTRHGSTKWIYQINLPDLNPSYIICVNYTNMLFEPMMFKTMFCTKWRFKLNIFVTGTLRCSHKFIHLGWEGWAKISFV